MAAPAYWHSRSSARAVAARGDRRGRRAGPGPERLPGGGLAALGVLDDLSLLVFLVLSLVPCWLLPAPHLTVCDLGLSDLGPSSSIMIAKEPRAVWTVAFQMIMVSSVGR